MKALNVIAVVCAMLGASGCLVNEIELYKDDRWTVQVYGSCSDRDLQRVVEYEEMNFRYETSTNKTCEGLDAGRMIHLTNTSTFDVAITGTMHVESFQVSLLDGTVVYNHFLNELPGNDLTLDPGTYRLHIFVWESPPGTLDFTWQENSSV